MSYNINNAIFGGNVALSSAGLTGLSGAATTYSTGATAVTYAIGGKLYSKAQVSGGTTPTTDVVTGATFKALGKNQGCVFVWTLDASGNYGVAQGPIPVQAGTTGAVTNVDDSGNWTAAPQFPALPDTLTAVAYVVIRTASTLSANFAFGTSNWNATGVTVATPQNVMSLPAFPQTA